MKKVLLFVMFVCGLQIGGVFAARGGTCNPVMCDIKDFDTKEMLTTSGVTGGDETSFSGSDCYVCDVKNDNSCNFNDIIAITDRNGSPMMAYQCTDTRGAKDTWVRINEMELGICGDSPLSQMDGVIMGARLSEIRAGDTTAGTRSVKITQTGRYASLCQYRECMTGYKPSIGRLCVKVESTVPVEAATPPAQTTVTPPANTTTPGTSSNCEARCKGMTGERRSQCVTCCAVSRSVAEWRDPKCVCVDSTKVWDVETAQCVTPTPTQPTQPVQPVADYECSASMISQLNVWVDNYPDCVVQINNLIEYCDSDPQASEANSIYAQIQQCVNNAQAAAEAAQATALLQSQNASRQNITSAISTLDGIKSGLKLTVWRDEEGKFNTSRLLSDSIAGVVLGTAGGLITSNVVKKNQVEDGFEDLQCAIGGQAVAGWGDEFRVGIQ